MEDVGPVTAGGGAGHHVTSMLYIDEALSDCLPRCELPNLIRMPPLAHYIYYLP